MERLTKSTCQEFLDRFDGFHDGWLREIHVRYSGATGETTINLQLVSDASWLRRVESGEPDIPSYFRVELELRNVTEFRADVTRTGIPDYAGFFELAIAWHARCVWLDFAFDGVPGDCVADIRESPLYFACRQLYHRVTSLEGPPVD